MRANHRTDGGLALGIDLGTTGARAALLDAGGALVATARAPLRAEFGRDSAAWWACVACAIDELRNVARLGGVRAIAVDGTSGTLVAVDPAGNPLGLGSMYHDRAAPEHAATIAAVAPAGSASLGATSPLARLLAMQDTPGAARVLHQADWIAGRLCGRFDTTDENNALKTGFDPVARSWPEWLQRAGARAALLPLVVPPGWRLGPVLPAIAARFGFPRDAVVVAGTTDGCAAFLATGASRFGEAVTSLGSTLILKLLCDRPVAASEFGIYSHRLGDRWLAGGASNSGGAALARYFDPASLAALSERIDPAADSGLDYYPLPAPGERFPIADAALPPRDRPRPSDDSRFLHGLLEGIARIEALGYRRLSELGAPPVVSVRTVGGGAANPVWTAIRARILGVPILPAASEEAAMGVAGLALRAVQPTPSGGCGYR